MAERMTLEDLARRFDDFDRRFDDFDRRFDGLKRDMDGRFDGLKRDMDGRFDELKTHMTVRFEETHRLIRLGLEGQEILKESMDRRFDAADAKEDDRHQLLTAVARHLRLRIEATESHKA